jgi:hypothetical protein
MVSQETARAWSSGGDEQTARAWSSGGDEQTATLLLVQKTSNSNIFYD